MSDRRAIRFGVFELDPVARELRRNGVRVRLQDQPFEVLRALVERPGEVFSKEELRERIWADDTYVDFDRSLATAVNKVRQALGDSATRPRFIETVPKRGYRFLADVGGGAESSRTDADYPSTPTVTARRVWTAVGLAAAVAVGVAFWPPGSARAPIGPPRSIAPITSYPGSEVDPSFSPEGDRIAFAWDGGEQPGQFDVYVQIIGESTPQRLTDDPRDERGVAWSPDGRSIVFARRLALTESELIVIPATGGPETRLGRFAIAIDGIWDSPRLAWTPDSRRLLLRDNGAIFALEVETRERVRLTDSPEGRDAQPAVSPDGARFAFRRGSPFIGELMEADLDWESASVPDPRPLTDEPGAAKVNPVYWRGEVVYEWRNFSLNASEIRVAGSTNPVLFAGAYPAVAASSDRIAFVRRAIESNLWQVRLDEDRRAIGEPEAIVVSSRVDSFPDYSPDGRQIVFQSDRTGVHRIWICDQDGKNPRQLTSLASDGSPRWSPDGSTIGFDSGEGGSYGIYVIDADGGRPRRLAAGSTCYWSADGDWIYYTGRSRGDESQVWRIRPDGSEISQVTSGGGRRPQEGRGDGFIYYFRDGSIWRTPLEGGAEGRVIQDVMNTFSFATARGGVFFTRLKLEEAKFEIFFWNSETGEERSIGVQAPARYWPGNGGLSLSKDEKRLLFNRLEPLREDLMLAEDFD